MAWGGTTLAWAEADTATVIKDATAFAHMDSSGNYVLGEDINITAPYADEFTGTFDGGGHTVTLDITTGAGPNIGLFKTLGGGAIVKNVITAGEIKASNYNNVGGIAGEADTSNGRRITIEKCKNTANISGKDAVGGILGHCEGKSNSVTIEECANIGNITGSNRKIGGIAGNLENSHAIRNCYNTGNIIGLSNYAGIIGRGAKGISVENCYTTGNITAYGSSTSAGYAIMGGTGSGTKCTVLNSYAVNGCATELCYSSSSYPVAIDQVSSFKESESMKEKAFATALGEKFRHNEGTYPTLEWEISTAKVPFNITPANAQLTITKTSAADEGSVVYTGTGGTIALPVGEYSYIVSCEGYTPKTGSVSVTDESGTLTASPDSVPVSLDKDTNKWGAVTFEVTDADNYVIKLTQNGVEVQPTNEKNKYELLINKEYSYVVSSSETGVEQAEGSITLTEEAKTQTEVVQLKKVVSIEVKTQPKKTQYYVGDKTIDTTGLVITVAYSDNSSADITSGFETSGLNTETVCESQDISVSYKGATTKYKISVKEKPFPSSVFNALAGKAEVKYISSDETKVPSDDAFFDATKLEAGCLKSNIAGKKNMSATVQIDFSKLDRAYELSFDYILSAEGGSYDYIKINNVQIGTTNDTEWKTYVLQVKKGDKVEITYRKDSLTDKPDDCIYLKDFKLKSIPQVTFNTVPADALVSMKAANGTETAASESANGKTVFAVQNGTYNYTVSAFGYKSETGTITVGSEDVTKDITLTKLVSRKATFNVTLPGDLKGKESEISITVKSGETIVKPESDGTYSLPQGDYTYTITHPKCDTAEGNFTIAAADVTKNITLTRKLVFSDFFDGLSAMLTATDDATYPFKAVKGDATGGSYNCLESTNKAPSSGYGSTTSTLTLEAKVPVKISFDAWYSTYGSDSSYYGLLLKKNDVQFAKKYGKSSEWENVSVKAKANDTIAIAYAYYRSYGSTSYEYCIRLKNFTVTPLTALTFKGAPEGAAITVKQDGKIVDAEKDGSYLLEQGIYTYSVAAFGYKTIEDATLDVSGSDVTSGSKEQPITMTQETKQSVTFTVTKPEGIEADATVTVKYAGAVKANLTKDNNYSCKLPADTYSYTITCEGCETETGEFTVGAEAKPVKVTLEKALTFEVFFTELTGRAEITDDTRYAFKPVKEGAVKYLQSSNKINGTESKITFTFTKPTRMSFDYMVSELGNTSTDSNYGLKIFRNEKLLDRYQEISTEWTSYEVFADAGDKITIAYSCYKNSSGEYIDDENLIKLKNFKAEPLTKVSFNITPKNAKVSISSGEQTVETIDGEFLLEKGSYTYSVKAFGYEDIQRASLTVDGTKDEDTVTLTMVPTARVSVSFQTTTSGAAIVVKNEAGETMSALDGNASSYSLPANEKYSYEVSAGGYVGKSGYFTADAAKTIKVDLVSAGTAWDGTTTKKPTLTNGVYQISSAAELAWFAEKTSKDASVNAILTANINLNNQTWTSIGSYSTPYTGTFDGNRKVISGLKGTQGLFDTVGADGTIKNLNLVVDISGNGKVGGVCGTLNGRIENTIVSGKIANAANSAATGGIAGTIPKVTTTSGRITGCINQAEIQSTYAGYASTLNIGGIVGYSYGTVENCYNIGSVKAKLPEKLGAIQNKAIGGIAGQLYAGGILKNSYTIGAVTGPETGIGSVIGINSGTVENTYVLANLSAKTIATNNVQTGVSIQEKTAEEMRNASFVYALGSAYNQDSEGSINNGFPVLNWQGGSAAVVPEAEQNALADMNAIVIKDKTRADALEAEKAEFTSDDTLEGWREFFEDNTLTWEDIFAKVGIDLTNDGTLSPDASGVYRLPDSCEALVLPTAGEKNSTIVWSSDAENITISSGTAVVTRPTGENKTVILTATVTNNNISKDRTFKILLTSAGGAAEETLKQIADRINNSRAFIQPMQMYDHTNIVQAMQQYLDREGYPVKGYVDQEKGIEVSLVSVGAKSMPQDGIDYISEDGTITRYYQGTSGFSTTAAIYNDVHFKLSLDGKEKEVTMRVHVGWDVFHVRDMLDKVLKDITWDAIKGENTNAAEDKMVDGWTHTAVSGTINQNLILPKILSKYSYAKISWTTVKTEDAQYIYAEDNGDGTATGILQRPTNNDKDITLRATATFNFWDDYTVQEMTSQGAATEPAVSFKFFDVTIAKGTEEEKAEMKEALVNKYPGLIRDFVNKAQTVDLTKVTSDLQMPRPSVLEENGIMSNSYNQHVTMTSSNTDVLQFNGYHAVIYRPLPDEEPETVNYTVTITDRRTKNVLAQNTFEMTILPLTQKEIDDAATWMKQVCTEDVYWNGIKGENTDKNHITGNLKPFEEILKNADGSTKYIRGTVNITFGGIDVDDLPGYDAMHSQPWREFRTNYQNVIASETLQVTKPEYDTQVTIDSVFTHTEMSKYWEKFKANEKYAQFEQFYKQPVSVTVTVKGEKGVNPNPQPTSMSVTVSVDGKNVNGFKSTSGIVISGLGLNATAWDAVSGALTKAGYKYQNFGDYISGVTDANGVTLTETDTANSGWLYTVNGKLPNVYMGSYYLSDKDNIVLYYTADYTKDPQAGAWAGETSKDVTTSGAAGSATTTAPTEVKVSEKTNADGTKETVAEVKLDTKHHDEIIKQAAEKKSAEIVLEVSKADSKGADNVQLTLDVTFVKNVADKTNADLTVNTENGKVTLDQETIKTVLGAAKGATITLEVSKVAKPTEAQKKAAGANGHVISLTVKSGNQIISDFNKGKATVMVELVSRLIGKKVAAIHIADDGTIEQLAGKVLTVGGKQYYEFATPHFSTFAIVDADEVGLDAAEEPTVDAKALASKLTPAARSAKTAKKNVKVTTSLDKQDKEIISQLKDAGYTVKYRFYRSTKKAAGYKAAVTKKTSTYTNISGKKGTKYFYKVQVRVYDASGKLAAKTALKQCRYASRTWNK